MRQGHSLTEPAGLQMPEGFDPSGIPCAERHQTRPRASTPRRRPDRAIPGLAPSSVIASVEEVASKGDAAWLIWGCAGDRPVLFGVEAGAAAEMMDARARGETPTAIVEPYQLMLERLD
jgi:hypothetical protein